MPRPSNAAGLNGDTSYTEGPNVCGKCHQEQFNEWLSHGHSRKLALGTISLDELGQFGLTVTARQAGFVLPDHDTDVFNWDNVLFIIGASKHWKTRFVDWRGYIITKNGMNQYNWQTGRWVDYDKNEEKPYSCGPCHTSGYRSPDEGGTAFSAFPGVVGDWAQFNVTCEACHGPGAAHAANPSEDNIQIDESAALCGKCHTRGSDDTVIIASGGYIKHHEQYPEFLNSPHKNFSCNSCHDPHKTRAQGLDVPEGKSEVCAKCHSEEFTEYEGSAMEEAGVMCQDCHMGKATKSAVANGPWEGDVWTHLFRINTDPNYDMFNRDENGATVSAKDALSLGFACLRCHADHDQAWAASQADNAEGFHTIGK